MGLVTITLTLVAVAGIASKTSAAGSLLAIGTIDETLLCSTTLVGGLHSLTVQAHTATGRQGSRWYRPALASVGTGGSKVGYALDSWLAWGTAGSPTHESTVIPNLCFGFVEGAHFHEPGCRHDPFFRCCPLNELAGRLMVGHPSEYRISTVGDALTERD